MRVLLIEDDDVIACELRLRWRKRGWMVLACSSLAAASSALGHESAQGFDLIVLDLGLPDGDGLDWLVQLRRHDRATPTLVLTARDQVSDRVKGLNSGADDYLVKPFAVEEVDARIEALTRRGIVSRGGASQFGAVTWLAEGGQAFINGELIDLSPREFEVLGLLIQRAPQLVLKRVLVDALAERNLEVGDSAVEVYISRLRRKLAGSGVAIRAMRGFGYLLVPDAAADHEPSP